ncbi:MAG: hypothetical protein Kow0047_15780 [Anaerolineae bacterium]
MTLQIDVERLLRAAQMTGALSGNGVQYGVKEAELTLSQPTLYGTSGLFSMCGSNDLISLTVDDEPFLEWLGWKPNNEVRQFVKLITYVGPAGTAAGNPTSGVAGPCEDANTVEFGTCEILLPDKGRIKRAGPVIDLTENNRRLCDQYPIFTKDGQRIEDELMWALTLAGIAVKQDLKRLVVTGNSGNANEFAGLEQLVNTGYVNATDGRRCSAMDSIVVNWNGADIGDVGPDGVHNLVDYLIYAVRRIRQRAMWASLGGIAVGDMAIVLPTFLRDELLNVFTCWSVCPGQQYREANLNTFEARTFRDRLNGGAFGMGQIFVDGTPIPIITYDWMPFQEVGGSYVGDIYVLTRRIGNVPVLWGQYIDMTDPAARFQEEAGYGHYKATDGGRFLAYWKTDNECVQTTLLLRPNVYLSAPWAQARIQSVAATAPIPPISPDPTSASYPEDYLTPATAPESYLVPGV